ncbi:MAG TPA: J domain-containing protein [Kofleriaceae bacterium]|nr:J domain-containing protein [Kofleriaceae bacterium]
MSAVPAEIAGIGSTQQTLRVSPSFDPLKAAVGPQEYFVLSRIDGRQTVREVLLMTGLPMDRAISIVQRLRALGALLIPGEMVGPGDPGATASGPPQAKDPVPGPPAGKSSRAENPAVRGGPLTGTPQGQATAKGSGAVAVMRSAAGAASSFATPPVLRRPPSQTSPPPETNHPQPQHDLSLPDATAVELAALAEDLMLDDRSRRRILAMARLADGRDPWALLGVPPGSDARQLKRAYFTLSKEIHPDRYFGQRLGSFTERLPFVFEALSRAYARLTSPERQRGAAQVDKAEQPQTPQEYAAELFERACQLEVSGDHLDAMKLFTAAVRVDPQPRYLRRAARCALASDQPRSAVEYAKKAHLLAPNDPSSARLLAAAFRAVGKLADAEEVLVMAMAIKSENDTLTSELRHDLAEVRRLLAQ